MAFVITELCRDEKAAVCLDVCPVNCIVMTDTQYVIDQIFALIVELVN